MERAEIREATCSYIGRVLYAKIIPLEAKMEELEVGARLQKASRFNIRPREQDQKEKCIKCMYNYM